VNGSDSESSPVEGSDSPSVVHILWQNFWSLLRIWEVLCLTIPFQQENTAAHKADNSLRS